MQMLYKGNINGPKTTLAAAISSSATTITVVNAGVLPDAPNIAVLGTGNIAETIRYGMKSGNVLSSVIRGFGGTAVAWPINTEVCRCFTAYDYNSLVDNILALKEQLDALVEGTPPVENATEILTFAENVKNNVSLLSSQTSVMLKIPLFTDRGITFGNKYYVDSARANDSGNGLTPGTAKKTIGAAISLAQNDHHDIVFIKSGTYPEIVNLNKSTTWLVGYGGNVRIDGINRRVVEPNGTRIEKTNRNPNITVNASYCLVMSLDSVNSPYYGIDLSPNCHNSMIINCSATDGADVGMICSDIYGSTTGTAASHNLFIGCASSYNYDFDSGLFGNAPGSSADGYENEGVENHYIGCSSYANSDDGFDLFRGYEPKLYNCKAFYSGRSETTYQGCRNRTAEKALLGNPVVQGDGNNFKMGPGNGVRTDTNPDGIINSKAVGCLSAYAKVMGYTNNDARNMSLIHCTGIGNLNRNFFTNVSTYGSGSFLVQNCLSYAGGTIDTLYGNATALTNSWNLGVTVQSGDFISLDPTNPNFGVLAAGSSLKNRADLSEDDYTLVGNNDLGWSKVLEVMPEITYDV